MIDRQEFEKAFVALQADGVFTTQANGKEYVWRFGLPDDLRASARNVYVAGPQDYDYGFQLIEVRDLSDGSVERGLRESAEGKTVNRGSFAKYAEDANENLLGVLREVEEVLLQLAKTDERHWALYGKVCALLRDVDK